MMKNISNTFIAQLSKRKLPICIMLLHLNHLLLKDEMLNNQVCNSAVGNNRAEKKEMLFCCISILPSIKTVAHLLIRADVPASHPDEGKKIKTALAKMQSQVSNDALRQGI